MREVTGRREYSGVLDGKIVLVTGVSAMDERYAPHPKSPGRSEAS